MPDEKALRSQAMRLSIIVGNLEHQRKILDQQIEEIRQWERINDALLAGHRIEIPDIWEGPMPEEYHAHVGRELAVVAIDRHLFWDRGGSYQSFRPDDETWKKMLPLLLAQIPGGGHGK